MNETDPSGDYTLGECATSSLELGLGSLGPSAVNTGSFCLNRTVLTPQGNDDIGFTETLGNLDGKTVGLSLGVSGGVMVSNANHLSDLQGVFNSVDLQGSVPYPVRFGFGGVAVAFQGNSNGQQIYGAYFGVSYGVGVSFAVFHTTTWVQQQNRPIIANPLRWAWDTSLLMQNLDNQSALSAIVAWAKWNMNNLPASLSGPCS